MRKGWVDEDPWFRRGSWKYDAKRDCDFAECEELIDVRWEALIALMSREDMERIERPTIITEIEI